MRLCTVLKKHLLILVLLWFDNCIISQRRIQNPVKHGGTFYRNSSTIFAKRSIFDAWQGSEYVFVSWWEHTLFHRLRLYGIFTLNMFTSSLMWQPCIMFPLIHTLNSLTSFTPFHIVCSEKSHRHEPMKCWDHPQWNNTDCTRGDWHYMLHGDAGLSFQILHFCNFPILHWSKLST